MTHEEQEAEQEIHILGMKERAKTEFIDTAAIHIYAMQFWSAESEYISEDEAIKRASLLWEARIKHTARRDGEIADKVRAIQKKHGITVGGDHGTQLH